MRPNILSGLIWVQTVCKGYRQTTKVTTRGERINKSTGKIMFLLFFYDQVKELVQECESAILQETATKLADIHEEFEALEERAVQQGLTAGQPNLVPNDRSPDKQWKWTGSCFVKSPTVEPWVRNLSLENMFYS